MNVGTNVPLIAIRAPCVISRDWALAGLHVSSPQWRKGCSRPVPTKNDRSHNAAAKLGIGESLLPSHIQIGRIRPTVAPA